MDQEMMLSVCLDSSTNMLRDQLACHQEEKLAVEEMRVLLWLGQDNCQCGSAQLWALALAPASALIPGPAQLPLDQGKGMRGQRELQCKLPWRPN